MSMDGSAPIDLVAQKPDQNTAALAGLSDGALTHIDTTSSEILLYISLPQLPFDEIDAASAYVEREQGLLVVHLPISAALASRQATGAEERAGDHAKRDLTPPGAVHEPHRYGEGHPARKLGDRYLPSSGEDHISKQQEIEAKTEPGDRENRRS